MTKSATNIGIAEAPTHIGVASDPSPTGISISNSQASTGITVTTAQSATGASINVASTGGASYSLAYVLVCAKIPRHKSVKLFRRNKALVEMDDKDLGNTL